MNINQPNDNRHGRKRLRPIGNRPLGLSAPRMQPSLSAPHPSTTPTPSSITHDTNDQHIHLSRVSSVEPTNIATSPQPHISSTIVEYQQPHNNHQQPNSTTNTRVHTQHIPQSIASTQPSIITLDPSQPIANIQQELNSSSLRKRPIEPDPIETLDLDWDVDIDESINAAPSTKQPSSIQTSNPPSNTASTTTTPATTNSRTPAPPRRMRVGISKRSLPNVPGEHQPITTSNDNPSSSNAR